jgi:uncharacterized OB-fold protein
MSDPINPVDFDRDTGAFFKAAREGRLVYRACLDCGAGIHMPSTFCGACGGHNTAWRTAIGTGTLFSWTTVMHQVHPAYPTPYTIVVVELDDAPGVRMIGSLAGQPSLRAGQPMAVEFDADARARGLPRWRVS